MLLSDFARNGTTLQGKAGAAAINPGDVLAMTNAGQLWPVRLTDTAIAANAGATVVATTTASSYGALFSNGKALAVGADGSIYIVGANVTGNAGLFISRYAASGALLAAKNLSQVTIATNHPTVFFLSNGNLCVLWAKNGGELLCFVLDPFLANVIASFTVALASSVLFDAIALVDGGFAVAYTMATGVFLVSYTNLGVVSVAAGLIAGSPNNSPAPRLAQLANKNLVCAMNGGGVGKYLFVSAHQLANFAPLGSYAVTVGNSVGGIFPHISVLGNVFAVSLREGISATAYVLSNTCVLQGTAFSYSALGGNNGLDRITNDGTVFWVLTQGANGFITLAGIPQSGAANAIIVTTPISSSAISDCKLLCDRGNLLAVTGANTYVFALLPSGACQLIATVPGIGIPSSNATGSISAQVVGDFCLAVMSAGTNTQFAIQKYQAASIVGMSHSTVAAGNPGMSVTFTHGPGGFPCNAIGGSASKAFDHSGAQVAGNRGVLQNNSAILRGM